MSSSPSSARPFDLSGRTALVTGASRGLGRQIALGLAAAGADVVVNGRRFEACRQVAEEIAGLGRQALPVAAHVGHWSELDQLVEAAYTRFGRIDVLVNNAGSSPRYGALTDVSEALFDAVVNLNLKGPFRLGVLLAERMRADGGGSIVNVTSVSGARPDPVALPYSAAKLGLEAVTRAMARAYGPSVRVNAIRPGAFATAVSEHWSAEDRDRYTGSIPLRRVGRPAEVVGAALYLASDASSFTTGTVLTVDGGFLTA